MLVKSHEYSQCGDWKHVRDHTDGGEIKFYFICFLTVTGRTGVPKFGPDEKFHSN